MNETNRYQSECKPAMPSNCSLPKLAVKCWGIYTTAVGNVQRRMGPSQ